MIGDRWGVTADEVARRYPCDDLVLAPVWQAWRGVTVQARSEKLWRWVGQIRLAPYSYDWIDNLGQRSPKELRHLPEPAPGQHFSRVGGHPVGRILAVEPGVHLTGHIMGAVMSYVLAPAGDSTRLLLKIASAGNAVTAPLLSVGDLVMSRRQLLTLKRLAEM